MTNKLIGADKVNVIDEMCKMKMLDSQPVTYDEEREVRVIGKEVPKDWFKSNDGYGYRKVKDYDKDEIVPILLMGQYKEIKKTNKMIKFFVILEIIVIVFSVINFLQIII